MVRAVRVATWPVTACLAVVLLSAAVSASAEPPVALQNDNRTPGGVMRNRVLTLDLEIALARWFPDADDGPSVLVYAFSERGKRPQIPGPLLRVPEGTEVQATVRNTLSETMYVRGLCQRPCQAKDVALEVPPGESRTVNFRVGSAGTYYYWAASLPTAVAPPQDIEDLPPTGIQTQLSGAFIVDGASLPADDRVFVIGLYYEKITRPFREVLTINGKSWPYSERFHFRIGESVRWRWVNPSFSAHAMHLHGFFYDVVAKGTALSDAVYNQEQRRRVVTERLASGETMSMHWQPHTPGNWIFHCHMMAHMSPEARLSMHDPKAKHGEHMQHGDAGMGGLVLGISVEGSPQQVLADSSRPVRKLKLYVRPRPAGEWLAGASYQLQDGVKEPDPNDVPVVGEPIVLTRGEPTDIEVINELSQPTVVHWHGIEIESYYDGVPGWGGSDKMMTPPISPGGSFVARMTPPYAGTYIYHTHWHDEAQLTSGLAGPLLVLNPGEEFDPEHDKIFLVTQAGAPGPMSVMAVNGRPQPAPVRLVTGQKYRFRFINITLNAANMLVTLRNEEGRPLQWRAVGKDGDALPPAQAVQREARLHIAVGETYDFELQPSEPANLALEFYLPFAGGRLVMQPVLVRGAVKGPESKITAKN